MTKETKFRIHNITANLVMKAGWRRKGKKSKHHKWNF